MRPLTDRIRDLRVESSRAQGKWLFGSSQFCFFALALWELQLPLIMSNRARSDGRVTDLSLPFGGPEVYGAAGGSEGVIGPGDHVRARARVALGGGRSLLQDFLEPLNRSTNGGKRPFLNNTYSIEYTVQYNST